MKIDNARQWFCALCLNRQLGRIAGGSVPRLIRSLLVLAGLVLLAACGVAPSRPAAQASLSPAQLRAHWLDGQAQLAALSRWSLKGRAAVRAEEESGTVSLFWQQGAEDFTLKLVAPFARGTLEIESDERGVKMLDNQGREHRAATAQGLVWLKTGWEIPFDDLQDWVVGRVADPDNPSIQVDAQARTLRFSSKGWDVSYPAYQRVKTPQGAITLPRKVYLKSGELVVKLAISEWQIP